MKKLQNLKSHKLSINAQKNILGGYWAVYYTNGAISRHKTEAIAKAWCRNHGDCKVREVVTTDGPGV